MSRTTLNVQQGTDAWLAARAASDGTASEAPAMMGKSKYQTRSELMNQRKFGINKEINASTQAIFDRGHETEALARPMAESIIGEELSPVTMTLEIDGMNLLASLDGMTFAGDVIFEHKLYSESLADQVRNGKLEDHYTIQMDQQLLVSGAEKCLFMTSDGTQEKMAWMWYEADDGKFENVISGWIQFGSDLATYVPEEPKAAPETKQAETLPVPSIIVKGEVTLSNLAEILPEFDRVLDTTNSDLVTDDHFAQADIDAKASRNYAKNLKLKAQEVIDQIAPVSEVVRTLETYAGKFDALGLKLEKAVKSQKDIIKSNAIMKARAELAAHINALESEIKPIRIEYAQPDFAGSISGVKTIATMQDRINTTLAQSKIEVDSAARDIRAKLAWCKENAEGKSNLFPDLQHIISKQMDDFTLLIKTRIAEAEKQEQERIQAEAQRIADEAERNRLAEAEKQDQVADAGKMIEQPTPINKQAVVIQHQDEITSFMKSRDFGKDANKIRAVLVEFMKWQAEQGMKKAA